MVTPFALFFALAVLLFAIELLVLQFSVFWVAFFGLGALVAAIAAYLFPSLDWAGTTAVFAVASALICLALLKPLRKWQQSTEGVAGNDAVGQRVTVLKEVTSGTAGQVHWSGTDWRSELAEGVEDAIEEGAEAQIVSLSGITLYIKPQG